MAAEAGVAAASAAAVGFGLFDYNRQGLRLEEIHNLVNAKPVEVSNACTLRHTHAHRMFMIVYFPFL